MGTFLDSVPPSSEGEMTDNNRLSQAAVNAKSDCLVGEFLRYLFVDKEFRKEQRNKENSVSFYKNSNTFYSFIFCKRIFTMTSCTLYIYFYVYIAIFFIHIHIFFQRPTHKPVR